ncbi:ARF guanine-nucleotide exchange factor 1 [Exophiala dermatitidis]
MSTYTSASAHNVEESIDVSGLNSGGPGPGSESLPKSSPLPLSSFAPFAVDMTTDYTTPAIAIDPVALITTECITITSAMRKHARWAQSSVSAILGGASRPQEQDLQRRLSSQSGRKGPTISDPGKTKLNVTNSATSADDENASLASRWGLRGKKGKPTPDNPLLSAFARLRRDLAGCKDVRSVDAPELLHPFLQVIRSSSTSAAITSLAVISVTKFFAYNIITTKSPRIALAMHLLSAAITHCRFEASDTAADEVVLLRILRLMELIISRPEGLLLGDESICEMMSTGLSMCCQSRLSEVLRRSAEMAMVIMCQVVFSRLKTLKVEQVPKVEGGRSRSNTKTAATNDDLKIEPPMTGSVMGNGELADRPSVDGEGGSSTAEDAGAGAQYKAASSSEPQHSTVPTHADGLENVEPYALPSIKELFRVLIDLLDPHDKTHTDPMRIMALRIIDIALEVSGPWIARQPALAALVQDDLCRHLFQLVRSDNMVLLNSSLRVAGTLLATCRQLLKLQQELFLSYLVACLHPRVDIPQEPGIDPSLYEGVPQAPKLVKPAPSQASSGRSTPVPIKDRQKLGLEGGARRPEAREAMVESIGTLVRMPSFMAELFVNYDCEVDRQDLCEDMVGLLSRNAFPDAATWSTTNVPPLCLDSLLTFIQFMAERQDQEPPPGTEERIEKMRLQRIRKRIIKSGASKFNDDPKAGVAYLVRNGIIQDPDDPRQVAQFLKGTSHVSKKVLGEFLTKRNNERLLTAFIDLFNFQGMRIDEALREMLGTFRLPGESALIERIVNTFTEKYCATVSTDEIADKDAAFVLTYAIIMLNTELYNPNLKSQKRMSYEGFARNLRGVNAGQDFPPNLLQEIYDAIKQNEIILPDEHDNKHAFEYAWKELLMKTAEAGPLELCDSNAFDAEMFNATWKPMVATLCYVFISASDDAVFSRVVVGFDQCAQIAAKYGITEAFDRIVYSVSQITGLAAEVPPSTALNTEVQVGKKRIMVSELAVRLGRDFRAQLATVLLFRILSNRETAVGDTWSYLVRILRNLFVNSLISLPKVEETRLADLGSIPLQPPSQVIDRDGRLGDSGIFSTFTSYLSSYAADDPPEPSEEELDNTLSAVDCVKACQPDVVLKRMAALPPEQIKSLVSAILSQMEELSPVVAVKPERPMPVTVRVNGHRMQKSGPEYDPGTVFLLELATLLTLRDDETIAAAGEVLTGALQNAVRDASNFHPLAASRVVHYLLELLRYSYTHDFMRAPVVLHAISSFDDTVLDRTAEAVTRGLANAIAEPGPLRNEVTKSPDFWSILQRLHQYKSEGESVFEILTTLATSQPTAVTADNFESAIALANDFATAGSIGSIQEKRRDFAAKRGHQAKPARDEDIVVVQRAVKAIGIIYQLSDRVPSLIAQSHLERHEAWAAYWSPVFRALCSQCVNPCREVRHRALSALQRTLLAEAVAAGLETTDDRENGKDEVSQGDEEKEEHQHHQHAEWTAIFDEVLFPLTLRLLKPEIYQLDPLGMNDTRAQIASLLCKVFLRYLDRLVEVHRMADVWVKILELLDRLMNAGTEGADALAEAVLEGVKNVLLVMDGTGYLERSGENKLVRAPRKKIAIRGKQRRPPQRQGHGRNQSEAGTDNEGIKDGQTRSSSDAAARDPETGVQEQEREKENNGDEERRPVEEGEEEDDDEAGMEEEEQQEEEEEEEIQVWPETVTRLNRFLPGLVDELFPTPPPPQPEPASAQAGEVNSGGGGATSDENRKLAAGGGDGSRPQTRDNNGNGGAEKS